MPDDYSNRQIGDFIVREQLGRGAMSVVYRAVQQSVNRSVALKIINLNLNPLAQENYQPYFIQEARVIATLEHIHIVPIYHYGAVDAESSFIASRLLTGGSVADLIEDGQMDVYRAVDIFSQAARGLAHAHRRGIIHRDLKPTNILLDDLGNAYLADFGLGKLAEVSLDLTEAGNVIGTPLYAAPEQLSGDPINERSDIYSMSAILYHMLAGCPPYDLGPGGLGELIRRQATETPVRLSELNPRVPHEIEAIIHSGLSRRPDERPESIEAMAESMNAALGRRSSPNSDPLIYLSGDIRPAETARRAGRPFMVAAIAGLIIIVAVMLALVARRDGSALPTVVAGARGDAHDVAPSDSELAAARAALGSNGFIAFVACGVSSQFQSEQVAAMLQHAAERDVPLRIFDSQMDTYRQMTQLELARVDGAKAIILCALDAGALDSSLQAAQAAGVPLVYLAPYEPRHGGVALDSGDYALGEAAGTFAGNIIIDEFGGEGLVVILQHPVMPQSRERVNGIQDGLFETAPAAYIVSRAAGATADAARRSVSDLLQQDTQFNMVISVNDDGAYGAIAALQEAGISPDDVAVVSINGEPRAQALVEQGGYLRATIPVIAAASAETAVDASVRLLGGGTLPEFIMLPPDGAVSTQTASRRPQ